MCAVQPGCRSLRRRHHPATEGAQGRCPRELRRLARCWQGLELVVMVNCVRVAPLGQQAHREELSPPGPCQILRGRGRCALTGLWRAPAGGREVGIERAA